MKLLNRSQALTHPDMECETVDVPEWGGSIRLRVFAGFQRDRWTASLYGADGKLNVENIQARLIALCAVDEHGRPMFSGERDISELSRRSAVVLDRLFEVAVRINKLGPKDVDELKKTRQQPRPPLRLPARRTARPDRRRTVRPRHRAGIRRVASL